MYFLPFDATVSQEEDPLAVMLNCCEFANAQANRIREDGFDSIEDMGIDELED